MILSVTMKREEHNELVLNNKLVKTLVVKLLREGVVLEGREDAVNQTLSYHIVGEWSVVKREIRGCPVLELRVDQ